MPYCPWQRRKKTRLRRCTIFIPTGLNWSGPSAGWILRLIRLKQLRQGRYLRQLGDRGRRERRRQSDTGNNRRFEQYFQGIQTVGVVDIHRLAGNSGSDAIIAEGFPAFGKLSVQGIERYAGNGTGPHAEITIGAGSIPGALAGYIRRKLQAALNIFFRKLGTIEVLTGHSLRKLQRIER